MLHLFISISSFSQSERVFFIPYDLYIVARDTNSETFLKFTLTCTGEESQSLSKIHCHVCQSKGKDSDVPDCAAVELITA